MEEMGTDGARASVGDLCGPGEGRCREVLGSSGYL